MTAESSERSIDAADNPTKGDVIFLRKPYCPNSDGSEKPLECGVVVEVLGNGGLFGVRFANCPTVLDFGIDSIASWRKPQQR